MPDKPSSRLSRPSMPAKMTLTTKTNEVGRTVTFRLYPDDAQTLDALLKATQEHYEGRVLTRTDLFRGLIEFAATENPAAIARHIRKIRT